MLGLVAFTQRGVQREDPVDIQTWILQPTEGTLTSQKRQLRNCWRSFIHLVGFGVGPLG